MYKIIEEKRTKTINALNSANFHPTNVLSTMRDLYDKGAYDMDNVWRKVVMQYLIEIGKNENDLIKIIEKVDKGK